MRSPMEGVDPLLLRAAKAAGITPKYMTRHVACLPPEQFIACWNPITDDGDAARLEAAMSIDVQWAADRVYAGSSTVWELYADHANDRQAARRRAVVRAAASSK